MSAPSSAAGGDRLAAFDDLEPAAAVDVLLGACHSRRWAEQVAAGRPYGDLAALQQRADEVWLALDPADWREALEGHPRIGESGGTSAELSRSEQAGIADADDRVRTELAAGNRAYEDRFGHVFLISAAGRAPEEILDALQRRLRNDPATELREAAEEHRRITRLRLAALLGS